VKVPAWLVAVAGALTTALYLASSVLPPPWGLLAYGLSFVAALLVGVGIQAPKFVTGKPVVPLTVVPVIASLVPALVAYAQTMPEGYPKHAVQLLAVVATSLAGLPLDTARPRVEAVPAPVEPQG
jgi:hypothetical protein